MNSSNTRTACDVREARATARSDGLDYVCPAHSITMLRLTAR